MNDYQRALELKEDTVRARRYLHEHAEHGLKLPLAQAFISEQLKKYGYQPKTCGQSVMAEAGQGEPVILLRADMDALPMQEESTEPFASKGDAAHTCGHDLHAAMLLTAARILKEKEAALNGTVRFLFQPAEEILAGAHDAIEHGILDAPRPSAALALHVAAGPVPPGQIFFNAGGAMMTSADRFRIEIHGKGGHGAYPNLAKDPITCAVQIISALQVLCAREAAPDKLCAISICSFHAGTTANIIPEQAVLLGAMHTDDPDMRACLKGRIEECVTGIASALGLTASVTWLAAVPPLICDAELTKHVVSLVKQLPIPALSFRPDMKANASEDFASIAEQIPACMLYLSAGFDDERGAYSAHHPRVCFNEDVLPIGAAIYAHAATQLLSHCT